jgi:ABC-2 type transport system permease protein
MGELHKLWAIVRREYLERVRTRWFVIATVFGPLVFGLLMFLPAYLAQRSREAPDVARVRIIDATGVGLGRRVASEISGGPMWDASLTQVVAVPPRDVAAAESAATRLVTSSVVRGYLILDDRTLTEHTARYAGINASALPDMRRLELAVQRALVAFRLERAGLSPLDAGALARMRAKLDAERVSESGRGGSGTVNFVFAISVAMLLYVTIFLYGQNVLRGVMEERQSRVAEVVVSSVRPTTLLAGKVLGVGAVGLTQMVIWLVTAVAMFEAREPLLRRLGVATLAMNLPDITLAVAALLLVFFVLGFTFYAALFAVVGATVNSEQEAQQAQLPVAMLLVVSISFLQSVISAPDGGLARTLSALPFSSPILMPLRLASTPVPATEVVGSLVALIAGCYVAVFVAGRVYRGAVLMYGKRPTLREMWRWVGRAG